MGTTNCKSGYQNSRQLPVSVFPTRQGGCEGDEPPQLHHQWKEANITVHGDFQYPSAPGPHSTAEVRSDWLLHLDREAIPGNIRLSVNPASSRSYRLVSGSWPQHKSDLDHPPSSFFLSYSSNNLIYYLPPRTSKDFQLSSPIQSQSTTHPNQQLHQQPPLAFPSKTSTYHSMLSIPFLS